MPCTLQYPDPHDTFIALLEQHRKIMYKVAYAYCRSSVDRDDVLAEMTAALWSSFGRFDDSYRFSTWMYRIVLNVAISFSRGEQRRRERASAIDPAALAPPVPNAEPDPAVESLHAFVAGLPDIDKALMLLYLDDQSYESIAAVLGLSKTNVATKLARLRDRARRAIGTGARAPQGDPHAPR